MAALRDNGLTVQPAPIAAAPETAPVPVAEGIDAKMLPELSKTPTPDQWCEGDSGDQTDFVVNVDSGSVLKQDPEASEEERREALAAYLVAEIRVTRIRRDKVIRTVLFSLSSHTAARTPLL